MRHLFHAALLIGWFVYALPLAAQQPCPSMSVVVNTPEDQLMLAVNGADNPQDQIAALEKYAQAHADSPFIPCVNEYFTSVYVKQNNFDKAIEYGEKDMAANYLDLNLILNLLRAYVGAGKANDAAFDLIQKAPAPITAETTPTRPPKATDEDWQKIQQSAADLAKDSREYAEYAFFQLLPRVTDANKRLQFLDSFTKSYPDTPNMAQANFQYFLAYQLANNAAKLNEYGEKAVASNPSDVSTLNLVANDYATRQTNLDKAAEYSKKVLELAPSLKKPEGVSDEQFKTNHDNQLGLAHATLGYIAFLKTSRTHRVASAIQEFKTAVDLLAADPALQGRTLFYLGYAYEVLYPPNHRLAEEALARSAGIASPWQGQARELLGKVRSAEHH